MPPNNLVDHAKYYKRYFTLDGQPRYCQSNASGKFLDDKTSDGNITVSRSGIKTKTRKRELPLGPPGSKCLRKALNDKVIHFSLKFLLL